MHDHKASVRLFIICCSLAGILLFAPCDTAPQAAELRPNLQAFAAFDLALLPNGQSGQRLIFSTTTWNSGDGPLELIAGETGPDGQKVYQRVDLSDGGFVDYHAGTFVWHPMHNHFHFQGYAVYTLQPVNAPGGSQRTSSKTTFCVIDTTKVNTTLPGAPGSPVYVSCDPTVQGMSVGWGDTYDYALDGQSFDFTGNPSGDYNLIIEVDPNNRLLETNDGDNIACALIRVNVTNFTVQVLDTTGCDGSSGGVVVSGITPNSMPAGTTGNVTITGTGFAAGMAVSFENGSGPRPTVSNVTVHNANTPNTITARVKVKSGGPASARVWDVRVGTGVLVDGFTSR